MSFSLTTLLMGRPVSNREAEGDKIGVFAGIPAIGLDGLSSAAYGPEAALSILVAAGAAGLAWIQPITWIVVVLLGILYVSYWQTITAYPNNGGCYVVARENLGANAGLLAGTALMIDYLLNVAVGISAGVGALTSALPALHPYTLPLCLFILAALTLLNLRGTREAGMAWSVPTYAFVASFVLILAWGLVQSLAAGGHPHPVEPLPPIPQGSEAIGLWLLMRSFASGCTAMTGVEAVSNGVSAFRDPAVRRAHATLTAIVVVLAALLLGIGHLTASYGIMAMDQAKPGYQTVLSQLAGAVSGYNWFYYVAIGSSLAVLCLSANTSFVGFPRLCRLIAQDDFLPRAFAIPGRRLVYTVGVLCLTIGSGTLLIGFGGITDDLIPLFAVGAFLSFTMSQIGMALHWRRALSNDQAAAGQAGARLATRLKLLVNAGGAVATGIALIVILLAKLFAGAWVTVIIAAALFWLMRTIHRHYERINAQILSGSARRIDLTAQSAPLALVPLQRWDQLGRRAIRYALNMAPEVIAVHAYDLEGDDAEHYEARLRDDWQRFVVEPACEAGLQPPRLDIVSSPYRSILAPLLRTIQSENQGNPDRPVVVILPEIIETGWGKLLLTQRSRRIRKRLLRDGGPDVAVLCVPWQTEQSQPARALEEEEPTQR
jgi:amino acid transporter